MKTSEKPSTELDNPRYRKNRDSRSSQSILPLESPQENQKMTSTLPSIPENSLEISESLYLPIPALSEEEKIEYAQNLDVEIFFISRNTPLRKIRKQR